MLYNRCITNQEHYPKIDDVEGLAGGISLGLKA